MNIVILGPQGSGKGTQAEKLAQRFEAEHIDMGRFLREVAKMDTDLGKEVHEIINVKKELVPARILEKAFTIKLEGIPREKNIIFDGFPRNMDQLKYFEKSLKEFGRKIDRVFFINLSREESIRRISKRRICKKCKKNFILGKDIKNEKDLCSVCGGEIIQRIDDSEEGVLKRLEIFKQETIPMVEYYKKQGILVQINGDQTIEKVFEETLKSL